MRMKTMVWCLFLLICVMYTSYGMSAVIYVDCDNLTGIEDGSITYPYVTIQDGIDNSVSGDRVIILGGNYPEDLVLSPAISGEIAIRLTGVIDGDGNDVVLQSTPNVPAIECNSGNKHSHIIISNITFIDGGINFQSMEGRVTIRDCEFYTDVQLYADSALYIESSFQDSASRIKFYHNIVDLYAYFQIYAHYVATGDYKQLQINNNIFKNAGSVSVYTSASGSIVHNNVFDSNYSAFYSNVWDPANARPNKFFNNIVVNSGGSSIVFTANYTSLTAKYNDIYTGSGVINDGITSDGTILVNVGGNLNEDPLFVGGGYWLDLASNCLDAGNPAPIFDDLDGTRNDMGIYGGSKGNW